MRAWRWLLLGIALPVGAAEILPLDQVRAGMRGYGLTVFEGTEVSRFEVESLGVLKRALGPQQDILLIRCLGERLQQAGVIAGMSGSPVYLEGKLVGALSLSLGSFSSDALAGVTPIEDMTKIDAQDRRRGAVLEPVMRFDGDGRLQALFGGWLPSFAPARRQGPAAEGAWRRLPLPLTFSGAHPRLVQAIEPELLRIGFQPLMAAGGATETPLSERLEPGSAVAVQLVRGDLDIAATGTVTSIEGNRVLAFGHPLLQLGQVSMPMVPAEILAIYPSQAGSYKISNSGQQIVGTCRQDRLTGILGYLDQKEPVLIPVEVELKDRGAEVARHRFELIDDPFLTPLLLYYSLLNSIFSVEKVAGNASFQVRAELELEGHPPLQLEDLFSGPTFAPYFVSGTIAAVFDFVAQNPFERVRIRRLALSFDADDRLQLAEITRIWADRRVVAPGESVRVAVGLRPYRGGEVTLDTELRVGADTPDGPLEVVAADALSLSQEEAESLRGSFFVRDLEHLLGLLRGLRPNHTVFVQLRRRDRSGTYLDGRYLPLLPPSAAAVLAARLGTLGEVRLEQAILGEAQLPAERVVVGRKKLELEVRRPGA